MPESLPQAMIVLGKKLWPATRTQRSCIGAPGARSSDHRVPALAPKQRYRPTILAPSDALPGPVRDSRRPLAIAFVDRVSSAAPSRWRRLHHDDRQWLAIGLPRKM